MGSRRGLRKKGRVGVLLRIFSHVVSTGASPGSTEDSRGAPSISELVEESALSKIP
jgi:hypothetical protein